MSFVIQCFFICVEWTNMEETVLSAVSETIPRMMESIGEYHLGLLRCSECGKDVPGAIGKNGSVPLLHILETGRSCPGVGQVQDVPLAMVLLTALASWLSLRRRIARMRFRLPIW